mmetsp:Transcript_13411/g.22461  ORF Transcript_13411/g.22461 Transcript_13411/m.22461 type:complete len:224 (-) Transcript_13411:206-877(-)
MDKVIIELDVGGKIFRTTKSTLCSTDSFFSRMLSGDTWGEGITKGPIFIDRDHTVFAGILSFLRSGRLVVSDIEDDDTYLEKLLIEADYYGLENLVDDLQTEIVKRKLRNIDSGKVNRDVYAVVGAPELSQKLALDWTYVDSFQGNETTACSSSGSKIQALWRSNHCTACGESMSYEKFLKHVSFFRPTMIVVKKLQSFNVANPEDPVETANVGGLAFNESFG